MYVLHHKSDVLCKKHVGFSVKTSVIFTIFGVLCVIFGLLF